MTEDFYDLLDIPPDASQDEIKEAYREKVRVYHPDVNDDDRAQAQFTAVKKAHEILGDPVERQAYDRLGHKDYVAKRTSGIPSPDVWGDSGGSDASADSSAGSSRTTASASASASQSATAGASTSGGTGSAGTGGASRTGGAGTAGSTTSRSQSGSKTRSRTRSRAGSTSETSSSTSTGTGTGTGTTDHTNTEATTGAATGTGTGTGSTQSTAETATSDGGTTARAGSTTTDSTARGTASSTGRKSGVRRLTDNRVVHWWQRQNFSLPLIWLSVLIYASGLVHFGLENRSALEGLVAELAAVGADPARLWTVLTTGRHGVEMPATFVVRILPVTPPIDPFLWDAVLAGIVAAAFAIVLVTRLGWRENTWAPITIDETIFVALALTLSTTLLGGPLLAGAVLMPLLFGVIVHHTRLRPGWKPSYLYVVPVLAPITGLTAGLVGYGTVFSELLAFVVLPLAGALGLPLRATIRKRFGR